MSFLNQSGTLSPFEECVPDAARVSGLTRSSILTQRRRCTIVPQGATSASPNQQINFLIADQGGLLDCKSIVVNYWFQASADNSVIKDDGHVFNTCMVTLNGQQVDTVQNCMKVSNMEVKLGGSKQWYQGSGSFAGWEALNPDLNQVVPTTTYAVANSGGWGYVSNNVADIHTRQALAARTCTNGFAGMQYSVPLGLMTGVGRMSQYLPIGVLGELGLTLITGANGEVLYNNVTAAGSYTLTGLSLSYDIVVPAAPYAQLLQKIASDPNDAGINIPFESTVCSTGAAVSSSASALTDVSIITSRATSNLLRAHVVFIQTALLQSLIYPSQSCFSHSGVYQYQFRIGSQNYPQIPVSGDSAMYNASQLAYGSTEQENALINSVLWGNSTNSAVTPTVFADSLCTTARFGGADSAIYSYGFQTVKGGVAPLAIDGVSLASASGSQMVFNALMAPGAGYTPYVSMVAIRLFKAQGGAVTVGGA
jgi:hypothetical protein